MILMLQGEHVASPIQVFVKPEPHKLSKLKDGRLRLISAIGFEDTMVDRILFHDLAETVVATTGKTPSMIGWVPIRGAWRAFRNRLPREVLCLDKAAWDWTVQPWLVRVLESVIHELAIDAPAWWTQLVSARFEALFRRAVFKFLDGTVYAQNFPGIMKSGCFLTIILNTLAQVILHLEACKRSGEDPYATMPFALGDDTVQAALFRNLLRYVQELEGLGAKVKEAQPQEAVEFAGFKITASTIVPTYTTKHLYKLEYTTDLPTTLAAYQRLYARDHKLYDVFRNIAKRRCPEAVIPWPLAISFMG